MLNNTKELNNIADVWIKAHKSDNFIDSELDWTLPSSDPNKCLDVILKVLEKIDTVSDNDLFSALAAGPLEDLLHENGEFIVDRIDIFARQNPDFRRLLNGVWDSEVDESVKSKLSKYMTERW